MSELEQVPDGVDLARGEAALGQAVTQIQAAPAPPVSVADRTLARALAAPRRSRLVRARAPRDFLRVSTLAITATLRARIDSALAGAAVGGVLLDVDPAERLTAVTVELQVRYGTVIPELGERARRLAQEVLDELLGTSADDEVTTVRSDVHVSEVTLGDPHLVDPVDEVPVESED